MRPAPLLASCPHVRCQHILTEFFETGALLAAGIGLQFVGIGIGLAQVYLQYQAEEAKRVQIAEDGIHTEVLRGIEAANEAIKQQEDVIAALIAAAALQAGVDTQSIDRAALRAFAWKQMFGGLPADATALRVAVTTTIKKRLDPVLNK